MDWGRLYMKGCAGLCATQDVVYRAGPTASVSVRFLRPRTSVASLGMETVGCKSPAGLSGWVQLEAVAHASARHVIS